MSTSKFLKIKVYLLNLIAQGYMKMGNSLMLASLENHIFLKTTETNQKMGNRIRHAVLCKNQTSLLKSNTEACGKTESLYFLICKADEALGRMRWVHGPFIKHHLGLFLFFKDSVE